MNIKEKINYAKIIDQIYSSLAKKALLSLCKSTYNITGFFVVNWFLWLIPALYPGLMALPICLPKGSMDASKK
jgi:hypothetical protein